MNGGDKSQLRFMRDLYCQYQADGALDAPLPQGKDISPIDETISISDQLERAWKDPGRITEQACFELW